MGLRRWCGVHSDLIGFPRAQFGHPVKTTSEENKGSRRLVRGCVHVGGDHGVEAMPTTGSRLWGSDDALDSQVGKGRVGTGR